MIHFDVSHNITTQEESDLLRQHLDGNWRALRLGRSGTSSVNQISAVIYRDEDDVSARAGWLLLKYPEAKRI